MIEIDRCWTKKRFYHNSDTIYVYAKFGNEIPNRDDVILIAQHWETYEHVRAYGLGTSARVVFIESQLRPHPQP